MSNFNNLLNLFGDIIDQEQGNNGRVNVVAFDLSNSPLAPFINMFLNPTANAGVGIRNVGNGNNTRVAAPAANAAPATTTAPAAIPVPLAAGLNPNPATPQAHNTNPPPQNNYLWNNNMNYWPYPMNYSFYNNHNQNHNNNYQTNWNNTFGQYVVAERFYYPTHMFSQPAQTPTPVLYYNPLQDNIHHWNTPIINYADNPNINTINTNTNTNTNTRPIFNNQETNANNTINTNNATNTTNNNTNNNTDTLPNPNIANNRMQLIDAQINDMIRDAVQNQFTDGDGASRQLTLQQICNTTSLDIAANTMTPADPNNCSICHADFVPQQIVRRINFCRHIFHQECIDTWLGQNSTCPVCRHDLMPRNTIPTTNTHTFGPIQNITRLNNDGGRRILINRTIRRRIINNDANNRRNNRLNRMIDNEEDEEGDEDLQTTSGEDDSESSFDEEDEDIHTHEIETQMQIIRDIL